MAENGEMETKTQEDQAALGGLLRFLSLAARGRRKATTAPPEPTHQPSPAEIRASALAHWMADDAARDVLFPWIDTLIANARAAAHLAMDENPIRAARWMGVEEGLATLLDELIAIRGQA